MLVQELGEAVDELDRGPLYRAAFGDALVDYIVMMKRAELNRFDEAVAGDGEDGSGRSAWEMREYFEFY